VDRELEVLDKKLKMKELEKEKTAMRTGKLFFRIFTIFMIQLTISAYTLEFYIWQPIDPPNCHGTAITILMCLLAAHMVLF